MLQLIIDAARGVSANVYWTRFFLGGSFFSLVIALISAWNAWVSHPTLSEHIKQIVNTALEIITMSVKGVVTTWILSQWWSIPVIILVVLFLWWRY